jgi:hypothetical protein
MLLSLIVPAQVLTTHSESSAKLSKVTDGRGELELIL